MTDAADDELSRLRQRVKRLAGEKSWLQYTITLMTRLSSTSGLDDTIDNVLRSLVDFLGGTNVILYYFIDSDIHYADLMGRRERVARIDDDLVQQAIETRTFAEVEHDFADTRMLTPAFTRAWTWAFPLLVGQESVGACKVMDMHLTVRELAPYLPPLFNHIALLLNNEILGYSRLKQAYDQLERANAALRAEVAEHERARVAITRQQTFTQAVLDNVEDGIVACDEQGLLSLFNRAAREFHGIPEERLPPEQWTGRYDLFLADGETPMRTGDIPLFRAFQGEHVRGEEMVIAPAGGTRRLLVANGQPMFDPAGHKLGAVVSMHDISAQRRFEQALARARDEAEAANRAKSVFLANMSHELRTPMNAILGFSQLLLRDPELDGERRESVETILRSGEHLLALINDVLEIAKIEAGRSALDPQVFEPRALLATLEEMNRIRAQKKGLELTIECAPEVPAWVRGDERKLRQVLLNLLGNAIKFTDTGSVALRARLRTDASAHGVEFEVADTGCGIPAEDLERVFDAFYQTADSVRRGEGTGLGLSICREYTRLMDGRIEVESRPGMGSTFRVVVPLPRALGEAPTVSAVAARKVLGLAQGQPEFRLLVVEDKVDNRRLLVRLLAAVGFQVREAANGVEALEVFHTWHPHLIWMDMRMPLMDGYEATRRIKATAQGRDTVVVALTASAFEEDRAGIMAAGCDDFLRKPAAAHDIYALAARHLGVEFLYGDERSVPAAPPAALTHERLAALPAELREEVGRVAIALDARRMHETIGHVRQVDPLLADELAQLASGYRYDEILRLVEQ